MPRPFVKMLAWLLGVQLLGLLFWVAYLRAALVGLVQVAGVGVHAVPVVFIMAGMALFSLALVRLRRRLREAGGRLCLRCGYDLRGIDDPGACPECGRRFHGAEIAARWRSYIAFDSPRPRLFANSKGRRSGPGG